MFVSSMTPTPTRTIKMLVAIGDPFRSPKNAEQTKSLYSSVVYDPYVAMLYRCVNVYARLIQHNTGKCSQAAAAAAGVGL